MQVKISIPEPTYTITLTKEERKLLKDVIRDNHDEELLLSLEEILDRGDRADREELMELLMEIIRAFCSP